MVSWALDGDDPVSPWSGADWAAPESAERLPLRLQPSAPSLARELLGVLARSLATGLIDAEQFQLALPLGWYK